MLYNVVLVSAVQQSESAICIHISPYHVPLEPPSHPPYPIPLGLDCKSADSTNCESCSTIVGIY